MRPSGYLLLFCVLLLFVTGLLMVFNTTSAEVLDRYVTHSRHQALLKQGMYALCSLALALIVWHLGFEKLLKWAPYLFLANVIFLILVFVPGFRCQINGAYRWIKVAGLIGLQPSEFMKITLPLYYIYRMKRFGRPETFKQFLLTLFFLCIPIFLIIKEPDNGTAAILLTTLMVLFFITGINWRFWAVPLLVMALVGGALASQMSHVRDRINIYLHPELDLLGKGHQPYQAKIATGSGQLWGRGISESMQKLNYLPEARSDYIAAIYAEELGFIGMLFLIVLYMSIATLSFQLATHARDEYGFYLAICMTFLMAFQAFLNLGVVSGLLPSKGTNLPFFSQGGSSLMSNTIALTLILNLGMRVRSWAKSH